MFTITMFVILGSRKRNFPKKPNKADGTVTIGSFYVLSSYRRLLGRNIPHLPLVSNFECPDLIIAHTKVNPDNMTNF